MTQLVKRIQSQFRASAEVKLAMSERLSKQVAQVATVMISALRRGGKILWCGNGGSAADSQHLATELICRLNLNRPPLASLALTTDTSLLTAQSNDFGFDSVFSRQVEALGQPGDILVGISTSGNSANVLTAIRAAKAKKIITVALTGKDGGALKGLADHCLIVPSSDTQRIQEGHITIGHILCDLIEHDLFAAEGKMDG